MAYRPKSSLLPLFVHKVLLEHSQLIYLCIVYDYFSAIMAEFNSNDKGYMVYKTIHIYYLAFYRKSLQSSVLEGNKRKYLFYYGVVGFILFFYRAKKVIKYKP